MAKLSPVFNDQTFDANGDPAVGYKLFTYVAGSSTKQATYTDSAGTTPQTNPIILNASGYPTNGPIWLTTGQNYKFVLALSTDTDPPTSPLKTIDNVSGVNDSSSSNTQWVSSGVTPAYVSATSFTLTGDQTTEFHVGRRLQFTVTAGTVYGTIITSAYGASTTVTVVLDSGTLDSGLSTVNLSILRADKSAIPAPLANIISVNGSSLAGLRNRLINGNFAINQRGVTGAVVLAAGAYGHDRWKAGAGGCSYTFAASGADSVLTITAGSLIQVVEGGNVEGGVYTLSHSGTAQARIAVNGAATAGAYATTPLASSSATGGQTVSVEFSTGTVGKVTLNPGTAAETFERRPLPLELMLCQRYYWRFGAELGGLDFNHQGYGAAATFGYLLNTNHPVEMRTTPTSTVVGSGSWTVSNCGQPAFGNVTRKRFELRTVITALGTYTVQNVNGGTYIDFSAEL